MAFAEFDDEDLTEVGGLTGAAIGGSPGAARALSDWASRVDPELAQIFQTLFQEWQGVDSFADLLEGISELASAIQEESGEASEPNG